MKDYLYSRTKKEFKDIKGDFEELFSRWLEVWNDKRDHDKIYYLYVKLAILCILLRLCLEYEMIDDISLPVKNGSKTLREFCNCIIHHVSCSYSDNCQSEDFSKKGLKIYLKIDTDKKGEVLFVINDVITLISKEIQKFPNLHD